MKHAASNLQSVSIPDKPHPKHQGVNRSTIGLLEVAACIATAVLFTWSARWIEVNPTDRSGQISGLSALQLHAIPFIVLVFGFWIWRRRFKQATSPLMFGILAGLSSSIVAGGVVVALNGSRWGLFAEGGDARVLAGFARNIMAGESPHAFYPPGFPHLLATLSEVTGQDPAYALKPLQIGLTALCGPLAYLTWRLTVSPAWALALGPLTALPVLEPYKAYESISLTVFIPAMVYLIAQLGSSASGWLTYLRVGLISAVLGFSFLFYSGWMLWSGLGILVLVPWVWLREPGRWERFRLLLVAATVFLIITGSYLIDLLNSQDDFHDTYQYFDTQVDPAYVLGWLGGTPGKVVDWPAFGELGGVGAFALLLIIAVAFAIGTARKSAAVQVAVAITSSAWIVRHWLASQFFATQTVQLYPRTSSVILVGLLILAVGAARQAWGFARPWVERATALPDGVRRAQLAGAVVAVIVLSWAQSSIADARMPTNDKSVGQLAWRSHITPYFDGSCPIYAPKGLCPPKSR